MPDGVEAPPGRPPAASAAGPVPLCAPADPALPVEPGDSEGGVGQRSGAGWPADPAVPPVPPDGELEAEPLLPELLLELPPAEPEEPGDWLVLPGNPSLPDDPPLPDVPGLPEGGDEAGGWGSDEEVDSLVVAHPVRASTPESAQATRDRECCWGIRLDSRCGAR